MSPNREAFNGPKNLSPQEMSIKSCKCYDEISFPFINFGNDPPVNRIIFNSPKSITNQSVKNNKNNKNINKNKFETSQELQKLFNFKGLEHPHVDNGQHCKVPIQYSEKFRSEINQSIKIIQNKEINENNHSTKEAQNFDFKKYLRQTNRLEKLLKENNSSPRHKENTEENETKKQNIKIVEKARLKPLQGDMLTENVYIQNLPKDFLRTSKKLNMDEDKSSLRLKEVNSKDNIPNIRPTITDSFYNEETKTTEAFSDNSYSENLCCFPFVNIFRKENKCNNQKQNWRKGSHSRYDLPILRLIPRSFPLS